MVTGASFERITEGDAIQALHIGPYATEPETPARMDALMETGGLRTTDATTRSTCPTRAGTGPGTKTILRQPVRRKYGG